MCLERVHAERSTQHAARSQDCGPDGVTRLEGVKKDTQDGLYVLGKAVHTVQYQRAGAWSGSLGSQVLKRQAGRQDGEDPDVNRG